MGKCYLCEEKPTTGYFSYYCEDCTMLRRLLLTNNPKKCIEILKRCLLRNDTHTDLIIS